MVDVVEGVEGGGGGEVESAADSARAVVCDADVDVSAVAASLPYVSAAAPTRTSQFATARLDSSLSKKQKPEKPKKPKKPPPPPPLASKQAALYRISRSSHIAMKPLFSAYVSPPGGGGGGSPPTVKPPANVIGARQIHRLVMVIPAS